MHQTQLFSLLVNLYNVTVHTLPINKFREVNTGSFYKDVLVLSLLTYMTDNMLFGVTEYNHLRRYMSNAVIFTAYS